jgi:hypothetical protein
MIIVEKDSQTEKLPSPARAVACRLRTVIPGRKVPLLEISTVILQDCTNYCKYERRLECIKTTMPVNNDLVAMY